MATSLLASIPIAQGRTADVYAWTEGTILKLYQTWCPSHWVEHEARVARAIVAGGIPTPAVVGELVEVDGRRGVVYERVEGLSMLQALNARPWTIPKHARELAELQARYQRLMVPGLHNYHASLERTIRRAPHLVEVEREELLELLATLPVGEALCHGDLHPGNVIISPKGPVIIDWMTAVSGNPWADVARTSLLLTVGPKAAGRQLIPLIRMFVNLYYSTYLKRYLALQPGVQDQLKCWRPVVAAARLEERIEPERESLLQMVRGGLR
jgi:aminoglycoside phosphotransferase (APT) family kinase protein